MPTNVKCPNCPYSYRTRAVSTEEHMDRPDIPETTTGWVLIAAMVFLLICMSYTSTTGDGDTPIAFLINMGLLVILSVVFGIYMKLLHPRTKRRSLITWQCDVCGIHGESSWNQDSAEPLFTASNRVLKNPNASWQPTTYTCSCRVSCKCDTMSGGNEEGQCDRN